MQYITTIGKGTLLRIQIVALLCLLHFTDSVNAQTAMVNVQSRTKTSLNGDWQVILDPTGAGDWKQVWQEKKRKRRLTL
jgi:beta-glucuronidase